MSAIKGKDTKPEVWLRKELFRRGFRYRLHRKDLPGKPDIVLPRFRTVIFVNGCFWHCHEGCRYFKLPRSNTAFWREKLEKNKARDQENYSRLRAKGWNVIIVWECRIREMSKGSTAAIESLTKSLRAARQN
ncbi:very short patch repair endonuclease [Marinobacter sp. es.048]|uniref:very short patch repair endonuclease n=1 Tax=Marinobacter sp. es.048 TaxID=1761795 RepID=UPI0022659297|nr:very short patch repair endonuclease [Marinobacter sp. es.048]